MKRLASESLLVRKLTLHSSVFISPSRVKLAHDRGLICSSQTYQIAAGCFADIATLATAHQLGMQYTDTTMIAAAQFNKVNEVQFLHRQGCPWSSDVLEAAVSIGDFELVRWCYERGCPWDASRAAYNAAQSSNVELMAWVLQQPGTQLCTNVMCTAVWQSDTAMCHYLHTQQCPWSDASTWHAAYQGDASLVRWLIDNGCPFDAHAVCIVAAQAGSVEVLDCSQQQGILVSADDLIASLSTAARHDQLAAAQWCRAHGAEWPAIIRQCEWHGELLQWARAEGYTSPLT
jgi:hypothetical protein